MLACKLCHNERADVGACEHCGSEVLPDDYELCGHCGFDHAYEYESAYKYHVQNPE